MRVERLHNGLFGLIALVSICLYVAAWPHSEVGAVSDDARAILAAQSLRHFSYRCLQLPDQPFTNFPLPGFPLSLIPWIMLLAPHWSWLKIFPLVCALASLWAVRALFAIFLEFPFAEMGVALFAWNMWTVQTAVTVWADSLYIVLILCSLLLLHVLFMHQVKGYVTWMIMLLVIWISFIRPEGIVYASCVFIELIRSHRYREGKRLALSVCFLWTVYLGINAYKTAHVSGYNSIWHDELSTLVAHRSVLWTNGIENMLTFLLNVIGNSNWAPATVVAWATTSSIAMIVISLAIYGLIKCTRRGHASIHVLGIIVLYLMGHFFLHAAWLAVHPHYLWPLLPFVILLLMIGLSELPRTLQKMSTGLLMLGLGVMLWRDLDLLHQRNPFWVPYRLPLSTFAWISDHVDPDAFILTPYAPALTLYTHRYSLEVLDRPDKERFLYDIQKQGITHLLLARPSFFYVQSSSKNNPNVTWQRIATWVHAEPLFFSRIQTETGDSAMLYRVQSSPQFMKAYDFYLKGMEAIYNEREREGLQFLNNSLNSYALSCAENAYGSALLLYRHDRQASLIHFKKAIELDPDNPTPRINRARILQMR